jgi:excisionase family DNA binding protein
MTLTAERTPVAAAESEQPILRAVGRVMQQDRAPALKLIASNGAEFILPPSVLRLFQQVVDALAQGQVVSLVPLHKELTTQEAADLLNVSRPYLIKLLDQGALPYSKLSSHRRIRFADLMVYKLERDAQREHALDAMAQLNQELGLYSDDTDATKKPGPGR